MVSVNGRSNLVNLSSYDLGRRVGGHIGLRGLESTRAIASSRHHLAWFANYFGAGGRVLNGASALELVRIQSVAVRFAGRSHIHSGLLVMSGVY